MERYELTASQKNIDELQRFYSGTSISVICGAVIFEERLDREMLMQAADRIIEKHEALRLRFVCENGKTMQYVSGEWEKISFAKFLSRDEMRAYCIQQAHIPFAINGSEMFRMTVFELPEKSGIILCASHLIADAMTYSILAGDVYKIYRQLLCGEKTEGERFRFSEHIARDKEYAKSEKYLLDRMYWAEKYSGAAAETPIRVCRKSSAGSDSAAERFTAALSSDFSHSIDLFCAENRISFAVLFEAAVIIYLAKINGDRKAVTIGVPVLGRNGARERKTAGMFISTIPLTIEADETETALSLCRKTAAIHREAFRHGQFPYGEILREIREKTAFSGRLFDVMVSCQNAKTDIKAETEWFSNGYSEVPFAFHVDNRDSLESYTITIDYQTDIFAQESEIRLISERIQHIIRQIIANKEAALKDISILPDEERKMLIHSFNDTAASLPNKCVHEAFSEAAAKAPDRTALVFKGRKYTYGQLDKMSDALAYFLRDKGITRNDVVPIEARRSPYIIIAMLGVLKAGGAYMPVSPDYPDPRIKFMTESVGARLALTYGCGCTYAEEIKLEAFDYSYTSQTPLGGGCPDDICYVIFTSGSTGEPKGTAITHKNVMNYCAENRFNVMGKIINDGTAGIVSVTDIVFDIFVTESILALLNGVTIYLADDEQAVSQKALSKLIIESGAGIIQTTPTKMRGFMIDKRNLGYLSGLRTIILGGEELSAELCSQLKRHTDAEIYNIYGPAETTVWSSIAPADENDITIGKPIANTRIYILDSKLRPVPAGIIGEICISGDGVGKGYINAPELTKERFLHDPYNPFFDGDIMYRTGDMGLIRCDGNIEFFGRRDNLIKLRGMRIELGEIENAICGFEGIGHSAVVCRTDGKGEKYLAGYYTAEKDTNERQLRQFISQKLPAYMIPNVFVRLEAMPMTASGKINRSELPEPDINAEPSDRAYTPPINENERNLCGIMTKVLGVEKIGTNDDFFELGGDSFSAMEFSALAEDMGYSFSPRNMYECRTVKKLCEILPKNKIGKAYRKSLGKYPLKRTNGDIALFHTFVKLTNALYSFDVKGLDRLDLSGRYIFCPNHESDLDCMWVWAALGKYVDLNDTCALIAAEHLDDSLHRLFFRISGGIPIERKGDFAPSLKRALTVIKYKKRFLLIHPEGTRTRNGRLGEFKKGAALLSKRSGIKAVPVYIGGAREIYPVHRKLPHLFDSAEMRKYPLSISFGTPIDPEGKTAERITEEIRQQIVTLKRSERLGNRSGR